MKLNFKIKNMNHAIKLPLKLHYDKKPMNSLNSICNICNNDDNQEWQFRKYITKIFKVFSYNKHEYI